jgi:CRP-like cAMP-binding protein
MCAASNESWDRRLNGRLRPEWVEAIRRDWPRASPKTIDGLIQTAVVVQAARRPIMFEGEQPSRVALVVDGTVAATWSAPDGRTALVGLFGPGQFIGMVTLFGGPMLVGIDALTDATVLTWDGPRFRRAALADRAMTIELLDRAILGIQTLNRLIKARTFRTARSRLAGMLITYEAFCFSTVLPVVPRSQLGTLAGVTPRMVNTIIRDWERAGIIRRVGSGGLELLDRTALAAEGAPLEDFALPDRAVSGNEHGAGDTETPEGTTGP